MSEEEQEQALQDFRNEVGLPALILMGGAVYCSGCWAVPAAEVCQHRDSWKPVQQPVLETIDALAVKALLSGAVLCSQLLGRLMR